MLLCDTELFVTLSTFVVFLASEPQQAWSILYVMISVRCGFASGNQEGLPTDVALAKSRRVLAKNSGLFIIQHPSPWPSFFHP